MNSMSKNCCTDNHKCCNHNHNCCNDNHNCCNDNNNCCKKDDRPCPTIIKCGTPSATTIPAGSVAGTQFTVSSITLNNSCLCRPVTKLEFASNLVAPVAFTGIINFQVFKLCRGQFAPVPVGPAWTFELVALLSSQTFSFFVCDCDSCFDDCCTYTVVATVTSAVTVGTLNINNANLGAITTCNSSNCC
ncbi:DUF4489 domain-containing protein [Clostridium senegalense]|uniref:DUF4489 domain-containing protein n=1 Tax=Clostridium senegalense TaxID=1465809 RepID=UPI001C10F8FC|nr:DUF4489 domain-containing protein [Clostridium senegalense]MBU5225204.1 DUF4489 domain-containing protein [Clostridium senegalense]